MNVEFFLISRNNHKKKIWDRCEDIKIFKKSLCLPEMCFIAFTLK